VIHRSGWVWLHVRCASAPHGSANRMPQPAPLENQRRLPASITQSKLRRAKARSIYKCSFAAGATSQAAPHNDQASTRRIGQSPPSRRVPAQLTGVAAEASRALALY
jgi:hypothetical protein